MWQAAGTGAIGAGAVVGAVGVGRGARGVEEVEGEAQMEGAAAPAALVEGDVRALLRDQQQRARQLGADDVGAREVGVAGVLVGFRLFGDAIWCPAPRRGGVPVCLQGAFGYSGASDLEFEGVLVGADYRLVFFGAGIAILVQSNKEKAGSRVRAS